MPDAGGNFKGISIPELPWLRLELEDKQRRNGLIRAAQAIAENAPAGAGADEVEEAPVE